MELIFILLQKSTSIELLKDCPLEIEADFRKALNNLYTTTETQKVFFLKKEYRLGIVEEGDYKVCMASSQKDLIKSTKLFKREASLILSRANYVDGVIQEKINTIEQYNKLALHNLITINAQIIQQIYSVVPDTLFVSNKSKNWHSVVSSKISINTSQAATALIKIRKAAEQFKVEMGIYDLLLNDFNESKVNIDYRIHKAHRVISNILYIFHPYFNEKRIHIDLKDSEHEIYLDYSTFQVSLYHILDNAVKYCMEDSQLSISIEDNEIIKFEMISLELKSENIDKIFTQGFRGISKKHEDIPGNGLGMYIAKKLLKFSKYDIRFIPAQTSMGSYCKNIIEFYPIK